MLVVIGIIAILATIAVPAGQLVLRKAREAKARAEMMGIVHAVKGYQTEYSRLPSSSSPPPAEDNGEGYDTSAEEGRAILEILIGTTDNPRNSRRIPFYEPPTSQSSGAGYTQTTGLRDIWGTNGYMMTFDYDGDGKIDDPYSGTEPIRAGVIVYSAGSDKKFALGESGKTDDLKTWN